MDSAGHTGQVVEACERHDAWFTITAEHYRNVRATIRALATDPTMHWRRAKGMERARRSQVAETTFSFVSRVCSRCSTGQIG